MRRQRSLTLSALMVTLLNALPVHGQDDAEVRKELEAQYQKLAVSENKLIAVAEVLQEVTRYRELDGRRRRVDTSVVQRETWAKTTDGWKLKLVDNVSDQKRFVDGKRVDPGKPYDPNAPPYDPDDLGTKKP